ncbi:MAG: lipid II flippase MurJ, partial [Acidimicrobiales bacterium]
MTTPVTEQDRRLLASTAAVTAGNLASRITGFLRVLAVGLALGTTFAGNTYQTSNLVSNVLFELSAAGLMSSVLIPPLVRLLDGGERREAERLAGSVLGLVLVALGVLTAGGLLLRPWIMRLLTAAVEDPEVRRQEVTLGSFLLVLFLPQILLYAVGAVATGLLHGARRFAAPAFAPVANNLSVIATMAAFWAIGPGGRPGLDLTDAERWVLGLGTTAGVVAMTLVPLVALRRAGLRLRPRWDLRQSGLGRLGRDGLWAAATLGLGQVLIIVTLVLANRVEGGVVAYHLAFQFFLLPFALLAHPVVTALYPRLASSAHVGDWPAFVRQLRGGAATMAFLVLPASAVAVAVAQPALRLLRLGNLDTAGTRLVAQLVAAYAVGLIGYAGFQLLLRASYAAGDTRSPTLVAVAVALGGTVTMVAWFAAADGPGRLAAVGFGHSLAYVGGTVA